jgi:hypothetical protein
VCIRVIQASKDLALTRGNPSQSFEKYCSLNGIDVEEQQFCYNVQGIKADIYKLLDFGADTTRICRKVQKSNVDFCSLKSASSSPQSQSLRDTTDKILDPVSKGTKRGLIYE